jgi:cytochrome c
MLKPFLLLSAVALFTFAVAPTQGSRPQEPEAAPETAPASKSANPVTPTPESQAKAKSIYKIDCALCHAQNGDGKTDVAKSLGVPMPDFTDPKSLAGKMDGDLFAAIRDGKNKMPPEASGRASNNTVWNLIIYIRNMSKDQAASPAQ